MDRINTENLIITDVNTLGIGYEKYPIQNTSIHSINENSVRWIDLYTIAENTKTKEKKKIKIRIDGGSFSFSEVSDKDWKEITCK